MLLILRCLFKILNGLVLFYWGPQYFFSCRTLYCLVIWLSSSFFLPIEADTCYDRILIYYQDNTMCIDPITRETYNFATSLSCDNIPQNDIALDLHNDEHYGLIPKSVLSASPRLSRPKQVQSAISPGPYTARKAGTYLNADSTSFWNRVVSTRHSDTILKFMERAISFIFHLLLIDTQPVVIQTQLVFVSTKF